jgi:hypothetical protein
VSFIFGIAFFVRKVPGWTYDVHSKMFYVKKICHSTHSEIKTTSLNKTFDHWIWTFCGTYAWLINFNLLYLFQNSWRRERIPTDDRRLQRKCHGLTFRTQRVFIQHNGPYQWQSTILLPLRSCIRRWLVVLQVILSIWSARGHGMKPKWWCSRLLSFLFIVIWPMSTILKFLSLEKAMSRLFLPTCVWTQ